MLKQFKSLSAGIVFIFSIIVAAGLVVFAVVVTAILSKYSIEANENVLEFAAGNVAETILGYQHFSENTELKETIELYQDDLYKSFSKYNTQDIQVYFFDTYGNLLISSEKPGYLTGEKITDSCINDVMIGGGAFIFNIDVHDIN